MMQKISEKLKSTGSGVRRNMGGIAIIISQHVLLLTSLYVIAGGIYIIAKATLEDSILVCTSLIIATVSV